MKEDCCKSEDDCCKSKDNCCSTDSMKKHMMKLTHKAWNDLMKEKMKARFQEKNGSVMDKVADVCVEGSMEYWTKHMAGEKPSEDDCKALGEKSKALGEKIMTAFKG